MARSCSKVLGVAKELEAEASAANRAFILTIDHLVPGISISAAAASAASDASAATEGGGGGGGGAGAASSARMCLRAVVYRINDVRL
jgi:hypothetical protein